MYSREEAAPERRLGEELEILRREIARGVGLLEERVGDVPVAPTNCVATCFEGGFETWLMSRRSFARCYKLSADHNVTVSPIERA